MALYMQYFRAADIAAHPDRIYTFFDNEAGDPHLATDIDLAEFRRHPNTIRIITREACPDAGSDEVDDHRQGCWDDETLEENIARMKEGFDLVETALSKDKNVVVHWAAVTEGASFPDAPKTAAAFMKFIDRLFELALPEGIPMLEKTRDADDEPTEPPCP